MTKPLCLPLLQTIVTPPQAPSYISLLSSIFMILITFFIILNALSRVDAHQSKITIDSVNERFRNKPLLTVESSTIDLQHMKNNLKQNIPIPGLEVESLGNHLYIKAPISSFFLDRSLTPTLGAMRLMRRLATYLIPRPDLQYSMTINIDTKNLNDESFYIPSLTMIANQLLEVGIQVQQLKLGFIHHEKPIIILDITTYAP